MTECFVEYNAKTADEREFGGNKTFDIRMNRNIPKTNK